MYDYLPVDALARMKPRSEQGLEWTSGVLKQWYARAHSGVESVGTGVDGQMPAWSARLLVDANRATVRLEAHNGVAFEMLQDACSPHRHAYFRSSHGSLLEGQEVWCRRAIWRTAGKALFAWGVSVERELTRKHVCSLLSEVVQLPDLPSILQGVEGIALLVEALDAWEGDGQCALPASGTPAVDQR